MTRTYYRLSLSAVCALAALTGPVVFLEDRFRLGYLLGGFGSALLTWALLAFVITMEPGVPPVFLGIAGAGAAVFSWMKISLVTVFAVVPHIFRDGIARFDPVWVLGGLSPLVILGVAWARSGRDSTSVWQRLLSALFRFSLPLYGVVLTVQMLDLAKQYRWLALFTGVMFLVLDALGTGADLPFLARSADDRKHRHNGA